MKKGTLMLSAAIFAGAVLSTNAAADARSGKMVYMKKLKHVCKKDGLKNGGIFAIKHDRKGWSKLKETNKLQQEWISLCPHGAKKIKKMREKDVKNLYDFVWKYASDGETPTCG